MPSSALADFPALNPTRSTDGKGSSILLEVRGHVFQAVFVCLPTGELSDPSVHGTRADPMTPEQRIELEAEARLEALRIKEKHGVELLAGMSVVRVEDLLLCVSRAPRPARPGDVHRLDHWDPISGADGVPDPPRSHPILQANDWENQLAWLFWGTLDLQLGNPAAHELAPELAQQLGAKQVHVRSLWLERPEVLAIF